MEAEIITYLEGFIPDKATKEQLSQLREIKKLVTQKLNRAENFFYGKIVETKKTSVKESSVKKFKWDERVVADKRIFNIPKPEGVSIQKFCRDIRHSWEHYRESRMATKPELEYFMITVYNCEHFAEVKMYDARTDEPDNPSKRFDYLFALAMKRNHVNT
jgi:hypothetical protein